MSQLDEFGAIIFDLDDTLFDFALCERSALKKLFFDIGISSRKEYYHIYDGINSALWVDFEKDMIEINELAVKRFDIFSERTGIGIDGKLLSDRFYRHLSEKVILFPYVKTMLKYLFMRIPIYVATNGVGTVQRKRIIAAEINRYFSGIYISEELGSHKPQPEFFKYIIGKIGILDKERILMVGDSLQSDIQGASMEGLKTCWISRGRENKGDVYPDFEVTDVRELFNFLKG